MVIRELRKQGKYWIVLTQSHPGVTSLEPIGIFLEQRSMLYFRTGRAYWIFLGMKDVFFKIVSLSMN